MQPGGGNAAVQDMMESSPESTEGSSSLLGGQEDGQTTGEPGGEGGQDEGGGGVATESAGGGVPSFTEGGESGGGDSGGGPSVGGSSGGEAPEVGVGEDPFHSGNEVVGPPAAVAPMQMATPEQVVEPQDQSAPAPAVQIDSTLSAGMQKTIAGAQAQIATARATIAATRSARYGVIDSAISTQKLALKAKKDTAKARIEKAFGDKRASITAARDRAATDIAGYANAITSGILADSDAYQAKVEADRSAAQKEVDLMEAEGAKTWAPLLSGAANNLYFTKSYAWYGAMLVGVQAKREFAKLAFGGGDEGIERHRIKHLAADQAGRKFGSILGEKIGGVQSKLNAGAKTMPATAKTFLKPSRTLIDREASDHEASILAIAIQVSKVVDVQATRMTNQNNARAQALLDALDVQEKASLADLDGHNTVAEQSLTSASATLKGKVKKVSDAAEADIDKGAQYLGTLTGADEGVSDLEAAVKQVGADAIAAALTASTGISLAAATGLTQIAGPVELAVTLLDDVAKAAEEKVKTIGVGIETDLDLVALKFGESVEGAQVAADLFMNQVANNATLAINGLRDATWARVTDHTKEIKSGLLVMHKALLDKIDTVLQKKAPEAIRKAAKKAAKEADVPTAVEKLVRTAVVVVVGIALTVVTMGLAAGALGIVLAGILAGTLSAVGAKLADDLMRSAFAGKWKFSSGGDYVRAGVIGGISGGLAGGGAVLGASKKLGDFGRALIGTGGSWTGAAAATGADALMTGQAWSWEKFFVAGALGSVVGGVTSGYDFGSKVSKALGNKRALKAIFSGPGAATGVDTATGDMAAGVIGSLAPTDASTAANASARAGAGDAGRKTSFSDVDTPGSS